MKEVREKTNPAAQRLFEEKGDALFAYCLTILKNPASAEDAAQEAFLRLIRNGADPDRDLAPLLFTIARNICLNERKRLTVRHRAVLPQPTATTENPQKRAMAARISARVRAEIDRLPIRQREVSLLTFESGFTLSEASEILGISPGTAASHKARALKTLRAELEHDYKEWMRDVD